jgi:hypothetical protein
MSLVTQLVTISDSEVTIDHLDRTLVDPKPVKDGSGALLRRVTPREV